MKIRKPVMTYAVCILLLLILPWVTIFAADDTFKPFGKKRDVPYVPTTHVLVDEMLDLAGVTEKDLVIDLGCGDGRIVIAAAKRGARGIGIDIDQDRIDDSLKNAREAGVSDQVIFVRGDLYKSDISRANVVTMYLLPSVNMKLRPKLLSDLEPGTRIVSHQFDLGEWSPDKNNRILYLWIVPANVSGSWKLNLDGIEGMEMILELEQKFQSVKGQAMLGDAAFPLENPVLSGRDLDFSINRGGGKTPIRYICRIDGDVMTGRMEAAELDEAVKLRAVREPSTKKKIGE